ncbi:hypothetical protein GWI33_016841 [Rhynchophorus ferrugineus]|uniref:Uncharacterized protein n=1 Tax=Rhynchophorus ferrugineus TaxID=354439 RepID=A0A834M886_RHYFE|nr:hypothetical protein GWI33_016841 [Rhynchophorus ferrugineus]
MIVERIKHELMARVPVPERTVADDFSRFSAGATPPGTIARPPGAPPICRRIGNVLLLSIPIQQPTGWRIENCCLSLCDGKHKMYVHVL